MDRIEALYNLDQTEFAQLLIEAGIDIRTGDAQILSTDVKVEVGDRGKLEYIISTRLDASESAQFNKRIDEV